MSRLLWTVARLYGSSDHSSIQWPGIVWLAQAATVSQHVRAAADAAADKLHLDLCWGDVPEAIPDSLCSHRWATRVERLKIGLSGPVTGLAKAPSFRRLLSNCSSLTHVLVGWLARDEVSAAFAEQALLLCPSITSYSLRTTECPPVILPAQLRELDIDLGSPPRAPDGLELFFVRLQHCHSLEMLHLDIGAGWVIEDITWEVPAINLRAQSLAGLHLPTLRTFSLAIILSELQELDLSWLKPPRTFSLVLTLTDLHSTELAWREGFVDGLPHLLQATDSLYVGFCSAVLSQREQAVLACLTCKQPRWSEPGYKSAFCDVY